MATLKIEPAGDGKLWVALTRFGDAELACLKKIAGARWNPERKQWLLPDTPATRAALVQMVAIPTEPPNVIAVKPKLADVAAEKTVATTLRGGQR